MGQKIPPSLPPMQIMGCNRGSAPSLLKTGVGGGGGDPSLSPCKRSMHLPSNKRGLQEKKKQGYQKFGKWRHKKTRCFFILPPPPPFPVSEEDLSMASCRPKKGGNASPCSTATQIGTKKGYRRRPPASHHLTSHVA